MQLLKRIVGYLRLGGLEHKKYFSNYYNTH